MFTIHKGDLSPSIADVIRIAGVAQNLTGGSVKFRMRAENSSTLKVDATATITDGPNGKVRHDWTGTDTDTPGDFLGWWRVTISGAQPFDTPEFQIRVLEHVPDATLYATVPEVKAALELTTTRYADDDVLRSLRAACRGIDLACRRRFWADADETQVRRYRPESAGILEIDDLIVLTSVQIDAGGDGAYETTWTNGTQFVLEPSNAPADSRPWEWLRVRSTRGDRLPVGVEEGVKVTGRFGWASVPAAVVEATMILAPKLVKRKREAPFGIVVAGVNDAAVAMRIARNDPDVAWLLHDLVRRRPF